METGDPPMPSWWAQHEAKPGRLMRSPCSIVFHDAGKPLCPGPPSLLPLLAAPLSPHPSPPLPLPLPNPFAQIHDIL